MRHLAVPAAAVLTTLALFQLQPLPIVHAQDTDAEASATVGGSLSMGSGESEAEGSAAVDADGSAEAAAEEPAAQDPVAEAEAALEARIVAMRARNTRMGPVGGLHVVDAGSGPAGSFRISLVGELMVKEEFLLPNDSNTHGGSVLSLGVTPIDWLELSAALTARSLSNTGNPNSPGLVQTLGDVFVDIKAFHEVKPGLTLGGDVGVWFLGGEDEVGKDFGATSAQLRLNLSMDLRELAAQSIPMIMRANVAYKFDNSAKTVDGLEQARLDAIGAERDLMDVEFQHLISRVERFALGINRVDMATLSLGAEWPIDTEKVVVSPLLEYQWGIPVNRQGFTCPFPQTSDGSKLPGADSCLDREGVDTWPATLTAALSLQPKRLEGLSLLAGVDVGLSGTTNFVQELAPNAPYMMYLGAGWAVDVVPREIVKEVEKKVEVPFEPPKGRVIGQIVEKGAGTPVPNARVHFAGTELTDLWANDQGRFVSYAFAPETAVSLDLTADGYEPGDCSTTIPEDASDVELTCEMIALPRVGSVKGLVIDGAGSPVEGVNVVMNGPVTRVVTTNAAGHFEAEGLAPGDYTARVDHEDHLIKVEPFRIEVRKQTTPRIQLVPKPKRAQVRVNKDRIQLRSKVYFATDTAEIEPRSEPLLEELADLLIRKNEILRVEVQGHTDNTGEAAYNQQLSQERADAVKQWLVDHGVQSDRLVAKGFGAENAVVPNITPKNRARNRRVELHIIEQLEPVDSAPQAKPKADKPKQAAPKADKPKQAKPESEKPEQTKPAKPEPEPEAAPESPAAE